MKFRSTFSPCIYIQSVYTDTRPVLFRLFSSSSITDQSYILAKQLNNYSNYQIDVQIAKSAGSSVEDSFKITFVPISVVKIGTLNGLIANNSTISFINCDNNPNSFIDLFSNLSASLNSFGYHPFHDSFTSTALPHSKVTFMLSTFH